jgi:hypothetical protein
MLTGSMLFRPSPAGHASATHQKGSASHEIVATGEYADVVESVAYAYPASAGSTGYGAGPGGFEVRVEAEDGLSGLVPFRCAAGMLR